MAVKGLGEGLRVRLLIEVPVRRGRPEIGNRMTGTVFCGTMRHTHGWSGESLPTVCCLAGFASCFVVPDALKQCGRMTQH